MVLTLLIGVIPYNPICNWIRGPSCRGWYSNWNSCCVFYPSKLNCKRNWWGFFLGGKNRSLRTETLGKRTFQQTQLCANSCFSAIMQRLSFGVPTCTSHENLRVPIPQFEDFKTRFFFEGFWQFIISGNNVSFLGGAGRHWGDIYEHLFDTSIMTILEDNMKTSQAH